MAPCNVSSPQCPKEILESVRRDFLRTSPDGYCGHVYHIARTDMTSALERIVCPTLIVCGELDVGSSVEINEEIQRGIVGSKMVVMKQVSHALAAEKPEEFAQILIQFLN